MCKRSKHRFIRRCLLVWLPLSLPLLAQPPDIRFEHVTVEQGLSNFSINDIAQDAQGFLWFATEDGLNRFDGYQFQVYKANPTDSSSLPSAYVVRLHVDRKGNLWVVAGSSLWRYDPVGDGFEPFSRHSATTRALAGKNVFVVWDDSHGDLWLGGAEGLYRYNWQNDVMQEYHPNPADSGALADNSVSALLEDQTGVLWVGTGRGGLNRFDRSRNRFTAFRSERGNPASLSDDFVTCLQEDRHGVLWIGTGNGLSRYDRDSGKITQVPYDAGNPHHSEKDVIFDIYEDSRGTLWLGTFHYGLWRYNEQSGRFHQYAHQNDDPHSLLNNRVQAIHEDRSGVMWLGHYRAGISRYVRRQDLLSRFKFNEGIFAVLYDRHGRIWAGGDNSGLLQFDGQGKLVKQYRHRPADRHSLSHNSILSLTEDQQGEMWVGTAAGVDRYLAARDQFERYAHQPGDPVDAEHHQAKALHVDRAGTLWVGTQGSGLWRLETGAKSFTYFIADRTTVPFHTVGKNNIWAIAEDAAGDLWLGSFGDGLLHFKQHTQTFTTFPVAPKDPDGLSHGAVYSLHVDSSGALWIGTFGGGLNRYDPRTRRFVHYTDREGLPDNFVKGILDDGRGHLWLSTDKGLSRFEQRSNAFRNFTVNDGLISNVLLSGAYCHGDDGRLYFGGEGGVIAFHPDSLGENKYLPPVLLTSFKAFDQPLPRTGKSAWRPRHAADTPYVILSYRLNFFSFEFVALDYTQPEEIQYAYKLEGFDADWVYCGTRRYASYTNVDPGEYTFRVKASNSDGVWNQEGATVRIKIIPPVWKTWWFRGLAAAVLLLLVWAAYRYRVNRLLEIERLRTRLAADLHDEIASNLSSIAMFGKIVQDQNAAAGRSTVAGAELLERMITLSQESVTSIREIIWAIDPRPERIHDLLVRVHDFAAAACRAQELQLRFEVPDAALLPHKNLAPEQRKHLWLLLKEAINNAVRHSGGSELAVRAQYRLGYLKISISDNGAGLQAAAVPSRFSGKGLSTMKSRAQQLRGSFELQSHPQQGTTVTVMLKI